MPLRTSLSYRAAQATPVHTHAHVHTERSGLDSLSHSLLLATCYSGLCLHSTRHYTHIQGCAYGMHTQDICVAHKPNNT